MTSVARRVLRATIEETAKVGGRLQDMYDSQLVNDIFRHSMKKQTGVSLKYMLDFGQRPIEKQMILSGQFLHQELPIRLAHRVAELENLPYGLSGMKPILKVRDWYVESFNELKSFPSIKDTSDEHKFTELLKQIYARHAYVVPTMAGAIIKLKTRIEDHSLALSLSELPEVHSFLDGFYLSRIGIRILIGQHISLHAPPREGYIGAINTDCNPNEIAEQAIADARSICLREYGNAPDVIIYGDTDLRFPYIPSHLHHMLFELIKNSLRAVSDRFDDSLEEPPPIRVIISQGDEDVTLKVSDEGGGIPRSGVARIWTYMYSTAKTPLPDMETVGDEQPVVLAGYGYGLPLSRLYARYFGGELQVISMEGYGTDAYLHLNRLGNSHEPLP